MPFPLMESKPTIDYLSLSVEVSYFSLVKYALDPLVRIRWFCQKLSLQGFLYHSLPSPPTENNRKEPKTTGERSFARLSAENANHKNNNKQTTFKFQICLQKKFPSSSYLSPWCHWRPGFVKPALIPVCSLKTYIATHFIREYKYRRWNKIL